MPTSLLGGDAASWGAAVRAYEAEKGARPMEDKYYGKPTIVTHSEKAREEVEYHPIRQTFTDPQLESASRAAERRSVVARLNRSRDRQISTEQTFDIINFSSKRTGLLEKERAPPPAASAAEREVEGPRFRHPLDSAYPFNILSNVSLAQQHYAPPHLRPRVAESAAAARGSTQRLMDPNTPPEHRLQTEKGLPRDFNILSNRYVEGHESKMRLEHETRRHIAAHKYWETHDYDPLLCTYAHPAKEAATSEAEAAELQKQPKKAFSRLPPSLQKSEGYVYDITSPAIVKDEELYEAQEAKARQWHEGTQATPYRSGTRSGKLDRALAQQGFDRQELEASRAHNRASFTRYADAYAGGYSIVDHRDYTNPHTYIPPARSRPPATQIQLIREQPVEPRLSAAADLTRSLAAAPWAQPSPQRSPSRTPAAAGGGGTTGSGTTTDPGTSTASGATAPPAATAAPESSVTVGGGEGSLSFVAGYSPSKAPGAAPAPVRTGALARNNRGRLTVAADPVAGARRRTRGAHVFQRRDEFGDLGGMHSFDF